MTQEQRKTILVVDDEEEVVQFLAMALEDAGFNVVTASDGLEALQVIRERKPDLISLDLVMPKHSGAKLFRDLKKDKQLARIPVLIVTGHARDELGRADFEELTMSGPGVYLEKPVKAKEYVNAVRKILHMEPIEEPSEEEETARLQDRVKALVDGASEETLREALRLLRERKPK